jgi:hypothetical protein
LLRRVFSDPEFRLRAESGRERQTMPEGNEDAAYERGIKKLFGAYTCEVSDGSSHIPSKSRRTRTSSCHEKSSPARLPPLVVVGGRRRARIGLLCGVLQHLTPHEHLLFGRTPHNSSIRKGLCISLNTDLQNLLLQDSEGNRLLDQDTLKVGLGSESTRDKCISMCVPSRQRLFDSDFALLAPQFLVEDMEIVPQLLLWEDFIETFLQACRSKDQINHRESLSLSLSLSFSLSLVFSLSLSLSRFLSLSLSLSFSLSLSLSFSLSLFARRRRDEGREFVME